MPKKTESVVQLAVQTARQISANSTNYMTFLTTAAHNFKYNFRDQLLIFAQKSDATACAQIDFWNKYGRWVNRGTTGIALLVDTNRGYGLRHVFDMSDTNSRAGRTIPIWQMKPQYESAVIEALENSYGELNGKPDFAECLLETAKIIVEDNFGDYYTDLLSVKEGSLLEELDDLSTETWFRGLLEDGVAFMMLTRCGIDPKDYFSGEEFAHVCDFNTPKTLSILGAAVSDIAEMPLREIASTVRELYREEQNRTFAERSDSRYNDGRIKSERSVEHGTDVLNGERVSVAQPGGAGGSEGRKIWDAAAQLSGQPQARDLHGDADERGTEQPSGEDRPAGHRDGGAPDGADGSGAGRDREPESVRSDEVGGPDEQHPGIGGGSGVEGAGLRLNEPLPTEEEQKQAIKAAEDEKSSAFVISQEDIDAVLLRGSGIVDGKFRIYEQFLKKESSTENVKFLKDEYGIGGAYPAVPDKKLDEWHDTKGIRITIGRISNPDAAVTLTWKKIEKRIRELIEADRYLSPAEKENYPAYRRDRERREARWKIAEDFRSIVYDYNDFLEQLGESGKQLNLNYLSSCWGAFGSGQKKMYARTGNGDYILPMMREAMQTIIGDNTHLTERCEAILAELNGPLAAPLEPTYDELNPPPEPKKEYRFSLGDTVYLGAQEYELLSFDDQTVQLYDPTFPLINKELPREEFDRMLAENPLNDHLLVEVEIGQQPEAPKYALGYGYLGNGVTVWNRLEQEHGDYRTIAHIAPDRTVKFYDDSLPEDIRTEIKQFAAISDMTISATQDAAVFSTPPQEQEPVKSDQPQEETDDFSDIDPAAVRAALAENGIVDGHVADPDKLDAAPFIQQVKADVEQTTTSEPLPEKRFSIIETKHGYAVWDGIWNEIYVNAEGIQEEFSSKRKAEDFLKIVRQAEADIEVTEQLPAEKAKQEPPPPPTPRRKAKVSPFVLHPEVPAADRYEYHITDDNIGVGTPGERFNNNVRAIRLLKKLEREDRFATPEEQAVLAQYVGWGGLADCFDERHSKYAELKALLTEDEYAAARESTLTAFYTPPVVIRSIYQALENMGFKTGNLLEPSCAIGNFIGMRVSASDKM